jgi:hypothetical protein
LYGGTQPDVCFAECLARFRPEPDIADVVRDEWAANGWMIVGSVPADWRASRVLARVDIEHPLPFVDITSSETIQALQSNPRITNWLRSFLSTDPVDLAALLGHDRRVTRLLSQWAYEATDDDYFPLYGGVRYLSRLGADFECWAIFQGSQLVELERHSISSRHLVLCDVAHRYNLTVH